MSYPQAGAMCTLHPMRCFAGPHGFVCILRRNSAKCHILGSRIPAVAMTPKFELGRYFCAMHLPQVSSCYVYSFESYRVDEQTNKQTPLKTSNVLRYATMLGDDSSLNIKQSPTRILGRLKMVSNGQSERDERSRVKLDLQNGNGMYVDMFDKMTQVDNGNN